MSRRDGDGGASSGSVDPRRPAVVAGEGPMAATAPTTFESPRRQRRIVAAAAMATSAGVLPAFLVGSQAVQIRNDLHFDNTQLGIAIAIAWTSAALASTPMGRLAESMGGGRALRVAALMNAVVMMAIGVAATSWIALSMLIAIGGVGNAMAQPAANLLTARTIPPDRQGFAFGVKQSAVPMATLLGGLAVPTITLTLGWRYTFAAGAAFALVAAAIVVGEHGVSGRGERAPRSEPPDPDATRWRAGRVPRSQLRPLLVLAAAVGLGAAAAGGLSTFLVSGSVAAGIEPGAAGLLLTVGSVVGISVRLFMGHRADHADRGGRDHLLTVALMMTIGSAAFAAMGAQTSTAYLLATPLAFGAGWAWPGLFNLSVVQAYLHAPGGATGITQTGTYLGAGLGPMLFGVMADHLGFGWAWPISATWLIGGALLMVIGRRWLNDRPALPS